MGNKKNDDLKHIKTSEHTFIVGMTGSGKSFFAETYLANYPFVIKLDIKGEYFERKADNKNPWEGLEEGKDFVMVEHLAELADCETPKIIYCPDIEEQNILFYDEFFRFCYERGNTIVWVDELMSVARANSYPKWLHFAMTRARSKNVGFWLCSQRPSDIPNIIIANCTHFVMYNLMLSDDRKKMAKVSGCEEMENNPKGKYTFWYYRVGAEHAVHARLQQR